MRTQKTFGNLSSTLYSQKTKIKLKLVSKGSLNFSYKYVLSLKQKTPFFSDYDIYIPDIIHGTVHEVHT